MKEVEKKPELSKEDVEENFDLTLTRHKGQVRGGGEGESNSNSKGSSVIRCEFCLTEHKIHTNAPRYMFTILIISSMV